MTAPDNTCYLERSKVRETILLQLPLTGEPVLKAIDALPIFTAGDFASVAQSIVPSDGIREALALRLRDAIRTAQNDDLSKPQTEKRERHIIRIEAMMDAAEYLEETSVSSTHRAEEPK
jgi:hypothetical protein